MSKLPKHLDRVLVDLSVDQAEALIQGIFRMYQLNTVVFNSVQQERHVDAAYEKIIKGLYGEEV